MSINTRKELLISFKVKYKQGKTRIEKSEILDAFIIATGYSRKYAISMLSKPYQERIHKYPCNPIRYDEEVKRALITIWMAANRICSKRLKPFISEFIEVLERHGHLSLSDIVRSKLLTVSTGTMDMLLQSERMIVNNKIINTTRSGTILKKQIKVRTFADWNDVRPGFFEADLVAHCGGSMGGSFLHTFTMTDIATGWTELLPLLYKSKENVISSLKTAAEVFPFPILGLDTDNGSEFINYALVKYCENNNITFTRSRAYKKNDQAHVEEKNGSIVRRIVGYDRFVGREAWQALTELYASVRLYVNFFQPSLKLLSKHRDGAKVTKKYDRAKTPYQRLLAHEQMGKKIIQNLNDKYVSLDPLQLLNNIKEKQLSLWKFSWITDDNKNLISPNKLLKEQVVMIDKNIPANNTVVSLERYHTTKKLNKKLSQRRRRRTAPDIFIDVWLMLQTKLELNPNISAIKLMNDLLKQDPIKYKKSQLRTLQRRVAKWRKQRLQRNKKKKINELTGERHQVEYITQVLKKEGCLSS